MDQNEPTRPCGWCNQPIPRSFTVALQPKNGTLTAYHLYCVGQAKAKGGKQ